MGGKTSTEAKDRWNAKTYDKLLVRIRKDGEDGATVEQIRHAAEQSGQSVNAWILDAIREKL